MEPAHRAVLRRLRLEVSGQLLVCDSVVPLLFQEEVLTQAQVEDIESRTSERAKALRLLDLLPTRGPRAFDAFLRALEDHSWIRDRILEEVHKVSAGGPAGVTDVPGLPDSVLQRVPSDQELSRLASRLGVQWESVLMELGLSVEAVFRCRSDNQLSSQAAALAGLIQWRRVEGRRATVQRLRESLEAAEIHPSVLEQVLSPAQTS